MVRIGKGFFNKESNQSLTGVWPKYEHYWYIILVVKNTILLQQYYYKLLFIQYSKVFTLKHLSDN